MNKSLEKICEEKAYKYGEEKCTQTQIGLPTWSQDYANGFKDAISTLRCENCKYSEKVDDGFYCCYAAFVTKDFGCVEFEKKESGV